MARKPRLIIGGVPVHVVQRGNNRSTCFLVPADFDFYLYLLGELAPKHKCSVHAYVLMTNHVHLLLTPEDEAGVVGLMKETSRRYAQRFNLRHDRTGTLWEGRYRSASVASIDYLLECYRYIELNPVRAGMVDRPWRYQWSSCRANALGHATHLVSPHPLYLGLAIEPEARIEAYRAYLEEPVRSERLVEIRAATRGGARIGSGAMS